MACHSPRHLLNNHLWPTLSFYPHLAIFTGWGWLRYLWRCFSGSLASSPFYSLVSARCIFSLKAHQPGLVNSIFACWCNTNNHQFPDFMKFPGLASHLRKALLPVHIFTGLAIFILAAVTALLGITEKAIFRFGINPKTRRLLTSDFSGTRIKNFPIRWDICIMSLHQYIKGNATWPTMIMSRTVEAKPLLWIFSASPLSSLSSLSSPSSPGSPSGSKLWWPWNLELLSSFLARLQRLSFGFASDSYFSN